jgi:dolichol kinase
VAGAPGGTDRAAAGGSGVDGEAGGDGGDGGDGSDGGTESRADELKRRAVHASGGTVPVLYLLDVLAWAEVRLLLVAALAVVTVLEAVRLWVGLDWWVYEKLTREYEQDNPAGYALFVVSYTAVAFAFEPTLAVPGMLMLAVGDPVSGLLGTNSAGRAKRAGVLAAMFGVCFALAAPFTLSLAAPPLAALAAAVGALGATVADGVKPVVAGYVVDDNLSIPPAACAGIWTVLAALG